MGELEASTWKPRRNGPTQRVLQTLLPGGVTAAGVGTTQTRSGHAKRECPI